MRVNVNILKVVAVVHNSVDVLVASFILYKGERRLDIPVNGVVWSVDCKARRHGLLK